MSINYKYICHIIKIKKKKLQFMIKNNQIKRSL